METPSLDNLVRRCQQSAPDDTAAFEMLVAEYKDRVYATAYRLIKVAEAATALRIVGIGLDDGSGVQVQPLYCASSGDQLECGAAPATAAKRFGVYVPSG